MVQESKQTNKTNFGFILTILGFLAMMVIIFVAIIASERVESNLIYDTIYDPVSDFCVVAKDSNVEDSGRDYKIKFNGREIILPKNSIAYSSSPGEEIDSGMYILKVDNCVNMTGASWDSSTSKTIPQNNE